MCDQIVDDFFVNALTGSAPKALVGSPVQSDV